MTDQNPTTGTDDILEALLLTVLSVLVAGGAMACIAILLATVSA